MMLPRKKNYSIEYYDKRFSWASAIFFIGAVFNACVKTVLKLPDFMWGVLSALVGIGILFFYLLYYRELKRRSSKILKKTVLIFLALYLLSTILVVFNDGSLSTMLRYGFLLTFAWWIPSGLFACSVADKEVLYKEWIKASYIIAFFSMIIFLFHRPEEGGYEELAEYNMSFGFFIILPLLFHVNEYFRTKKLWLILLILLETYAVIVYASRGVILSLVFFLVYKFAYESNNFSRKFFSTVFLISVGIIMLLSLQTIASAAVDFLSTFGARSRTLDMMASGVIDKTSGRNDIWDICFGMIMERPITGWGLGGEYQAIADRYAVYKITEDIASCSPHNGIVQNFVEFGIIGGLISSLIVIFPLFNLKTVKDRYAKILIVIFCASRVIPDLISGDGFFTEPKVAIYLFLFYYWKHGYVLKKRIAS